MSEYSELTNEFLKHSAERIAEIDAKIEDTAKIRPIGITDMPDSAMSGRLGDLCRGPMKEFPLTYSYLSIVVVAGLKIAGHSTMRHNLYGGPVGDVGSGKSQAAEAAMKCIGLDPDQRPPVHKVKVGSGEQLLKEIGDVGGESRLFYVDELSHLLEKAMIQYASFPSILNSLFYNNRETLKMARGETANFDCSLSILGGLPENKFSEFFGQASTLGLYDRFLYGLCPTDYTYHYRPFRVSPSLFEPQGVEVHPEVWNERDQWLKDSPDITGRVAELSLRVASICAAWDGKNVLMVSDLKPAKQFALYQARLRKLLRPNPGENFEARAAHKFLAYLERHSPDGQWVSRRQMFKDTRAYELGPSVCHKALSIMAFNGDIEENDKGRQALVRRIL
jgi:hypothetical protein